MPAFTRADSNAFRTRHMLVWHVVNVRSAVQNSDPARVTLHAECHGFVTVVLTLRDVDEHTDYFQALRG